jgi:hypothetical protein
MPVFTSTLAAVSGRLSDSVYFQLLPTLSTDSPVSQLNYFTTVTAAPLTSEPTGSFTFAQVSNLPLAFGGYSDQTAGGTTFSGGTTNAPPAQAQDFVGTPGGGKTGLTATISGTEAAIPAVNEGINGCGPGSAARSLKYLQAQTGINVTQTAQQVYDTLRDGTHMKTVIGKNGGTTGPNFLMGKQQYTTENKLPVTTSRSTSFVDAINALNTKGDVEILIDLGVNGRGQNMGGHIAFVSSIVQNLDAAGDVSGYTVKLIQSNQAGGMANNQTDTLQFDADGNLQGRGRGAQLTAFQIESVPEPASFVMLLTAVVVLLLGSRCHVGRAWRRA